MNMCALAGQLARKAVVHGTDRKVVRFRLETRSSREEGEQDRVSYVPCALTDLAKLAVARFKEKSNPPNKLGKTIAAAVKEQI